MSFAVKFVSCIYESEQHFKVRTLPGNVIGASMICVTTIYVILHHVVVTLSDIITNIQPPLY